MQFLFYCTVGTVCENITAQIVVSPGSMSPHHHVTLLYRSLINGAGGGRSQWGIVGAVDVIFCLTDTGKANLQPAYY